MKSLVYTVVIDTMQEEKVRRGRKRRTTNSTTYKHRTHTKQSKMNNEEMPANKDLCRGQITTRQHNNRRNASML